MSSANVHSTPCPAPPATRAYGALDLQALRVCFADLEAHLRRHTPPMEHGPEWRRRLARIARRIAVLGQLRMDDHDSRFSTMQAKHPLPPHAIARRRALRSTPDRAIRAFAERAMLFLCACEKPAADWKRDADRNSLVARGRLLGPLWEAFETAVLDFMLELYLGEQSVLAASETGAAAPDELRGSLAPIQFPVAAWSQSKGAYLAGLAQDTPRLGHAVQVFMRRLVKFTRRIDAYGTVLFETRGHPLEVCVLRILRSEQRWLLAAQRRHLLAEWQAINLRFFHLTADACFHDIGGQG